MLEHVRQVNSCCVHICLEKITGCCEDSPEGISWEIKLIKLMTLPTAQMSYFYRVLFGFVCSFLILKRIMT